MKTMLESQGTVDSHAEEQAQYAFSRSQAQHTVTVAVTFQQIFEDNSDILRSREVEQEVLDMLDE